MSAFERHFFSLAGTYFACLWRVMGNDIEGHSVSEFERSCSPCEQFESSLQGVRDYSLAMKFLCHETMGGKVRFDAAGKRWRME